MNRGIAATLLLVLAGCASNQHLIFFTNSTIGLEISTEPQTGSPAKFVLGYKRTEGVIDPLLTGADFVPVPNPPVPEPTGGAVTATAHGYFVSKGTNMAPHSVLAKMNFGATGGGSSATAAQWFATGLAAEELARAPGIAAAVTGQSSITVTEGGAKLSPAATTTPAVRAAYHETKDLLAENSLSAADQARGLELVAHVDALDAGELRKPFTIYKVLDRPETQFDLSAWKLQVDPGPSFDNVLSYLESYSASFASAKKAVPVGRATLRLTHDGAALSTAAEPTDAEMVALTEFVTGAKGRLDGLRDALTSQPDVLALVDFWNQNVLHSSAPAKAP